MSFDSSGEQCAAWLYRPETAAPTPCVILAHGFSGTREDGLAAYAERFAAAGLAALVFDYRHFGASEGEPRQLIDADRQLADWRAALAFMRTLEGVDPSRIALWGSSYSGGHVIELGAGDGRVAAIVSQIPFTSDLQAIRAAGLRLSARLTLAGVRDELAARRGRAPYYVPAAGPAGTLAGLTGPEVEQAMRTLVGPDSSWENRYTPRSHLRRLYRPYAKFGAVRCPVLVCVCDKDHYLPPAAAVKAAQRAPNAELRRYPTRHFDIYQGEWFERSVTDETEFLTRHLLPERTLAGDAPPTPLAHRPGRACAPSDQGRSANEISAPRQAGESGGAIHARRVARFEVRSPDGNGS